MKKILFSSTLFLALILMAFKPSDTEEKYPILSIGAEMPMQDYVMLNVNGDKLKLSDEKRENGTLIIFSCNTCPFVQQWEDRFDEIAIIADAVKVGAVLVNPNEANRKGVDSFKEMKARAKEKNYTMPYTVDDNSALANAFGAKTTPHVYLFDANNKLVYVGAIDDNSKNRNEVKERYLYDALKQLASGRDISTPTSKAVGCSIKRAN